MREGFVLSELWGGHGGVPASPLATAQVTCPSRSLLQAKREMNRSRECAHSPLLTEAHLGNVDYLPCHYCRL